MKNRVRFCVCFLCVEERDFENVSSSSLFSFLNGSRLSMKRVFLLLYSPCQGLELVIEIKRVLELEIFVMLPVCLPHFDAYSEKGNLYLVPSSENILIPFCCL